MNPIVYYNPRHTYHISSSMHPESPERVEAIMTALNPYIRSGVVNLRKFMGRFGSTEAITHWTLKDGDTYVTNYTNDILKISRVMIRAAVSDIVDKNTSIGFVLTRPPGHHASEGQPSGFCHENNVWNAVGMLRDNGYYRIGIYDWDAHHGDGTQTYVENDDIGCIKFASTHAYGPGIYPGSGKSKHTLRVLNHTLSTLTESEEFISVFDDHILPFLSEDGPLDILIVSAGYDAHKDDPMNLMQLESSTYGILAERLKLLNCPILFMLEGGYNPAALAESVLETLIPFMPLPIIEIMK